MKFDYVIVGAGSAGCVLANRLSEDGTYRVLLIEAGGGDTHPFIRVPIGLGMLQKHRMFDWMYETIAEDGLGGRTATAPRGKVLGGSSSVNFMAFTRGDRGDYDRWARNGAAGWSWNDVLPYFKRSESWQGGETAVRGGSGPVGVEFARTTDPLFDAVAEAARALDYPLTDDYNDVTVGFGRAQLSIRNGRRSSAATAYLREAMRRPNLTVLTQTLAQRVLLDGTTAYGVEYERDGVVATAEAAKEVVLCGGAFNSPHLLMLSGIGPADHLRAFGITPVVDLPVGDNLQDHLKVELLWERPVRGPFHGELRLDRAALNIVRAYLFGTGPATVLPFGIHAFVKTDPSLDVPDLEFLVRSAPLGAGWWFPGIRAPYRDGFGIAPVSLHPESRGSVRLNSADPRAPVRIHYNYLSAPGDIVKLREGFKRARELGNQSALDRYRGEELIPGATVNTDDEIDAYIRRTTSTVSHPIGTARMGTGPEAVLDPQLRVRGIEALRVVDGSALPDLVSAHTNAAIIMMAEKAADLLRGKSA